MTITRLETGARMSNAVIHNGTIYLAGIVGEPRESVGAQTRTILAEIDRLLALFVAAACWRWPGRTRPRSSRRRSGWLISRPLPR